MKKILLRVGIGIGVLLVLGIIAAVLLLDRAIKTGVETVGPMLTKVDVKLDSAHLSLLSGGGTLKGLFVGNPQGFKTPSAIQVGSASLSLKPSSVFSDKVVIKSIDIQAPDITFETDLRNNNLSKILANVEEATGGGKKETPAQTQASGGKKLQVDEFRIEGGKINVSLTTFGGKSVTVPLPPIHLTQLGTGPEGITPGELVGLVLKAIEKEAVQASAGAVNDLGKQAADLGKGTVDEAGKTVRGVTDLFKKKK